MSGKFSQKSILNHIFTTLVLLGLATFIACGGQQAVTDVYPGETWERIADPESVGFTKEGFEAVGTHLDSIPSSGLVVAVGGKILYEHGKIEETSYIASVRKSVLAMLYGNYVADGTIDTSASLADLGIDDIDGLSDQEKEATVADLLGARSGVYHKASNPGDNLADAPPRNSQKHGTYMLYSNWDFNCLGYIFESQTGRNIYDAVQTDLVDKIGMADYRREMHKKSGDLARSKYPAYHMYISSRDLARLGLLMLRGGKWNGEQVVPESWTKKIASVITPLHEMNPERMRSGRFGYGYLWWMFMGPEIEGTPLEGAYTGIGAGGQYLTVIPKLDMVITHKNNRRANRASLNRTQYYGILDAVLAARK